MQTIVRALLELSRTVIAADVSEVTRIKRRLTDANLLHYLQTYQTDLSSHTCGIGAAPAVGLSTGTCLAPWRIEDVSPFRIATWIA